MAGLLGIQMQYVGVTVRLSGMDGGVVLEHHFFKMGPKVRVFGNLSQALEKTSFRGGF